jgi:L-alanine-DL-glutamate epimerase-like enolase superfamily enzyme
MAAIGAVDTALWDIKAKAAGMPLYQLLGGRSRDGVLASAHAGGETIEDTLASVAALVERGYKAVRVAVPNFGIQEHMPHSELTDRVFPHAYRFEDGSLHPGEAPGLGVELDEELAARHPYQRAHLPVARRWRSPSAHA